MVSWRMSGFLSETGVGGCGPEIGCALGNDEEDVTDGRQNNGGMKG